MQYDSEGYRSMPIIAQFFGTDQNLLGPNGSNFVRVLIDSYRLNITMHTLHVISSVLFNHIPYIHILLFESIPSLTVISRPCLFLAFRFEAADFCKRGMYDTEVLNVLVRISIDTTPAYC